MKQLFYICLLCLIFVACDKSTSETKIADPPAEKFSPAETPETSAPEPEPLVGLKQIEVWPESIAPWGVRLNVPIDATYIEEENALYGSGWRIEISKSQVNFHTSEHSELQHLHEGMLESGRVNWTINRQAGTITKDNGSFTHQSFWFPCYGFDRIYLTHQTERHESIALHFDVFHYHTHWLFSTTSSPAYRVLEDTDHLPFDLAHLRRIFPRHVIASSTPLHHSQRKLEE